MECGNLRNNPDQRLRRGAHAVGPHKVSRAHLLARRAAKNRALRSFFQQNSRESDLITTTAPGYVHGTFMDIRLLGANSDSVTTLNHRTGTNITRAFFGAHLLWGEQENCSRFASAPGKGIVVEKPSH